MRHTLKPQALHPASCLLAHPLCLVCQSSQGKDASTGSSSLSASLSGASANTFVSFSVCTGLRPVQFSCCCNDRPARSVRIARASGPSMQSPRQITHTRNPRPARMSRYCGMWCQDPYRRRIGFGQLLMWLMHGFGAFLS